MINSRIIPCLLLDGKGLVKTHKFRDRTYIGDPCNAIKIFNEKEVDELILLDIQATNNKSNPSFEFISEIASECFMPFAYGGGIASLEDMNRIIYSGAEKIIINTQAILNPILVQQAAEKFGSQSIVVSIDVKKDFLGRYKVYLHNQKKIRNLDPVSFAIQMQELGAGELMVNSVDKDGTMTGMDLDLIKMISTKVDVPVIACGGAGTLQHLKDAIDIGCASAVSAGSMFVFYGKKKAVLISYPSYNKVQKLFSD